MLESLPARQPGKSRPQQIDLAAYPLRIRPSVLPQRPADRLPQPERGVVDVLLDDVHEQVEVGLRTVLELAEDRRAAQPQVISHGPPADRRGGLPGVREEYRPDQITCHDVDEVPPGAGGDEVLVQSEGVRIPPLL